jgi:hypothetical protein
MAVAVGGYMLLPVYHQWGDSFASALVAVVVTVGVTVDVVDDVTVGM